MFESRIEATLMQIMGHRFLGNGVQMPYRRSSLNFFHNNLVATLGSRDVVFGFCVQRCSVDIDRRPDDRPEQATIFVRSGGSSHYPQVSIQYARTSGIRTITFVHAVVVI